MKKIVVFISIAAVAGGCSVYRTYERPDLPVIDSLYQSPQPAGSADTVSLAALSWKELFTDEPLQQLIETGLRNNVDLEVARLKVAEAEAMLRSSKLAYLPSVSLAPQGSVSRPENAGTARSYDLAAAADWELDIFGRLTNAKREAKAALEESEAYRQAVQTQLVATIADSYYTLLMLDEQVSITRRTAENWAENLRVMQALKRAGQTTQMAVAQTEASKLSADASVLTLERQISETENALCALLGIPSQHIGRSTLDAQRFPQELAAGVPLQLLQRRPDVRQSEAALAGAFYAANAARAAFYPSVTLSGSAGWTNAAGGAISNPGQWLLSAVGSLVQPLFMRGQNAAALKVAKAQQQEALLAFRQSLLDAGMEVNNALVQWQTARRRLTLDEQQIVSLRSAVRSSELLMRYSSQNYLEVLTARQTLLQAELSAVSDRFDEIQGVINLYHALGGGY